MTIRKNPTITFQAKEKDKNNIAMIKKYIPTVKNNTQAIQFALEKICAIIQEEIADRKSNPQK
jgi:hypothetical protein